MFSKNVIPMKRALILIIALISSTSLWAQTTANEWLVALQRTLGSNYATNMVLLGEETGGMMGYFVIDGDSYYLTLGAMEVYCDGKLRYEVNNDRKEVVEDRANLEEGDILTNPTRAFDFVSDVYNLAIDSVTANGATIRITPKSDVAEVTIYIDVVKRGSKVLPERVLYDYDGEGYTIELGIIEGTPDATPKWNKANYRGYDIVSFL